MLSLFRYILPFAGQPYAFLNAERVNTFAELVQNIDKIFVGDSSSIVQQAEVVPDDRLSCQLIEVFARQTEVHSIDQRKVRENTAQHDL